VVRRLLFPLSLLLLQAVFLSDFRVTSGLAMALRRKSLYQMGGILDFNGWSSMRLLALMALCFCLGAYMILIAIVPT
jgi:hypothetical protein